MSISNSLLFASMQTEWNRLEAKEAEKRKETTMNKTIDIVFDGPPWPEAGRFVEVEDQDGKSISIGEWVERPDGFWALRIQDPRQTE